MLSNRATDGRVPSLRLLCCSHVLVPTPLYNCWQPVVARTFVCFQASKSFCLMMLVSFCHSWPAAWTLVLLSGAGRMLMSGRWSSCCLLIAEGPIYVLPPHDDVTDHTAKSMTIYRVHACPGVICQLAWLLFCHHVPLTTTCCCVKWHVQKASLTPVSSFHATPAVERSYVKMLRQVPGPFKAGSATVWMVISMRKRVAVKVSGPNCIHGVCGTLHDDMTVPSCMVRSVVTTAYYHKAISVDTWHLSGHMTCWLGVSCIK
jgi:hypothetical protein